MNAEERAREIVHEWLQHDVDDFTQSCIADRGDPLIARIAAALQEAAESPASNAGHAGARDKSAADKLADEVAVLVRRGIIDSRSAAADALLDYREPPSSPRADRLVERDATFDANVERLKACEHIAEGDGGWQVLRNLCPSTAAVAALRDALEGRAPALPVSGSDRGGARDVDAVAKGIVAQWRTSAAFEALGNPAPDEIDYENLALVIAAALHAAQGSRLSAEPS
jgi:hypothetical protein